MKLLNDPSLNAKDDLFVIKRFAGDEENQRCDRLFLTATPVKQKHCSLFGFTNKRVCRARSFQFVMTERRKNVSSRLCVLGFCSEIFD